MKKKKFLVLVILILLVSLAATAAQKVIKIGVNPGPHEEIMEVVRDVLAKKDIKLDIVTFSDFVTPNLALADGSIDANSFQHEPYLKKFAADRKLDLVKLAPTIVFPIGIYSKKVKSIYDLKNKAIVAIPNDPTNAGRVLMLFEKAGLIKLKDGVGLEATLFDIVSNPKNLQFKELEAAQLPRVLPDVDIATINTTFAIQAGLDPLKDAIYSEDKDSLYVNIIAVRAKDVGNPLLKELVEAYHSKEVADYVNKKYAGSLVLGFTEPK